MPSYSTRSLRTTLGHPVAVAALLCILVGVAFSQGSANDPANLAWQAGAIRHMQEMRSMSMSTAVNSPPRRPSLNSNKLPTRRGASQPFSRAVRHRHRRTRSSQILGPTDALASAAINRKTVGVSARRACKPASMRAMEATRYFAWPMEPRAQARTFPASMRNAKPIACLLNKGLIRVGLPMPANAEFQVVSVSDPYDCNNDPATGLKSPTTGIVSIYRRPLPSTNLGFRSAIMWDGREPSLESQAVDARSHRKYSIFMRRGVTLAAPGM